MYVHIRARENKTADLLSRWQVSLDQYRMLATLVKNPMWVKAGSDLLELNYEI